MWYTVRKKEWEMSAEEATNKCPLQEAFLKSLFFLKQKVNQFGNKYNSNQIISNY